MDVKSVTEGNNPITQFTEKSEFDKSYKSWFCENGKIKYRLR
jgi:hypothetical protein